VEGDQGGGQAVAEVVPRLLAAHPPAVAFRIWTTDHLVHYMMTKRGLADALRVKTSVRDDLNPETVLRGWPICSTSTR
jgi:hypothetical protein